MSKVDPYSIKRKVRPSFERRFTDPVNPDAVVVLKVRRLSNMERVSALSLAETRIQEYVTGYGLPDTKGYIEPRPLPPVDGEAVLISEGTARVAALLATAQVGGMDETYSFEELVALMVSDAFCEGFTDLMYEIAQDEEEANPDPLASKASGAAS